MNQGESDDFAPEYLIPLSGSDGPIPLPSPHPETPQTFRVEEEQPKSSEASKRSRSMSPNYPIRIEPRDKKDDQFNSIPRRVSFPASSPVLSRSRSDSLSQSSHERFEESPRKRLMFDGIVKGVLDSSDRMDQDKKRVSFGTTAQDDTIEPIKIWNMEVPLCLSRIIQQPPSLARISVFIVQIAPCFWCGSSIHSGSTDRAVLTRLNTLCLFFAFFQLFGVGWLVVLLLILPDEIGEFDPHYWNINVLSFAVGALAFILITICFCTIRVIREVDLVGAIRFNWALAWILPFQSFFTIGLFDYHHVTSVWIRHWWTQPQLSWFRSYFCLDGTEDTLCVVPIMGGEDYQDEKAWCQAEYNATDCKEIRDDAQSRMNYYMISYYTALGVWGCLLLLIMTLLMNSLHNIISKPIVQKAREANIPAWLLLPTLGNGLAGVLFLFSPSSLLSTKSGAENEWIGFLYMLNSALFFVAMLTGWFISAFSIQNNIDKKKKSFAVFVFIFVMAANTILLATLFVVCLIFSVELVATPIGEASRGSIACYLDDGVSCTQCEDSTEANRCPEWTLEEVTNILQTQLKLSATISAIFFLYSIRLLRYGFVLSRHLSAYQIDYV